SRPCAAPSPGASPRPSRRARSPRARAPHAARGEPPGPGDGRRPARGSRRAQELEAAGHVPDLPAEVGDLLTEPVGLGEGARDTSTVPRFGERDDIGRCSFKLRHRAEPEEVEPDTQVAGKTPRAPVMKERERVRRIEVVVEDLDEALLLLRLARLCADEDVPARLEP